MLAGSADDNNWLAAGFNGISVIFHFSFLFADFVFWLITMIQITLPDGSQREFSGPITVAEVAQSIGPGLAKNTVAGKVDGRLVDACDTAR